MSFIKPAPGQITSPFGPRVPRPLPGVRPFHDGVDLGCSVGSSILSAAAGTVTQAALTYGGYGARVIVDHGDGHETRYAHLSRFLVSVGDVVTQGQRLALSGGEVNSWGAGSSTGPHLHHDHLVNGAFVDPVPYWSALSSSGPVSLIDEDVEMKIIAPYGLPDRGVIAPGFGYAFPNEGEYKNFLNVWKLGTPDTVKPTIVGDRGQSSDANRKIFYSLINMHGSSRN